MLILSVADFVGSVIEVAVMVTLAPLGMVDGAVNWVCTPLAVLVGANVPQVAVAQLALQLTDGFAVVSLVTSAVSDTVAAT
jgi:hypothetical protein